MKRTHAIATLAHFLPLTLTAVAHGQEAEIPSEPSGENQVEEEAVAPSNEPAPEEAQSDEEIPISQEQLTPPRLLKDAQPEYPKEAERLGVGATVVLELDVDVEGKVESARVVQPAEEGEYGFDEAALSAALRLEFSPALEQGAAVPVRITYRFRFDPRLKAPAHEESQKAKELPKKPVPRGEISGRLLERGTRNPLAGAKVTVFRGENENAIGFETETDEDGRFVFEDLQTGTWKLLSEPEGYFPVRVSELVEKGTRTEARYFIEKKSYNPYDVVVETERVRREVNHTSIDARRAESLAGSAGDVLGVVQNFPGVARAEGNQLIVRGSAAEDSQFLMDGIRIPRLHHFGDVRSVIPTGMIERIDFYPGNFSVEYGRATGGIVDLELKELSPRKPGGYLDVNVLDTSVYLEAPLGDKFSLALAYRRSYFDLIEKALVPDSEGGQPRYFDTQALASYRPSDAHQLNVFFALSGDKFELKLNEPQVQDATSVITDFSATEGFYRGIAEYDFVPSDRFSNEMKFSFGRDQTSSRVGREVFVEIDSLRGEFRDIARFAFSNHVAVRGGLDAVLEQTDYSLRLPALQQEGGGAFVQTFDDWVATRAKGTALSMAGFAELELAPWDGTLFVPGVRVDQFSRTKNVSVSPRITARQALGEKWDIKGGIGLFTQEPQFQETDAEMGNPDLGLEKAMHYSAGFEYRPLRHLKLDVTGFYKSLHDLVAPTAFDAENPDYSAYENDGKGRVIGLEVSAKHELFKNFYGWVAYTLSKSERKDPGQDAYRLFDYDQTHVLTLLGAYQLPHGWEISSRFRLVTGTLYTPVTGSVFNADSDSYLPTEGPVNSARLATFNELDFRIDKRWVFEHYIFGAYLEIQNVYNRPEKDYAFYNFDYSEKQAPERFGLLPILGLRGEF